MQYEPDRDCYDNGVMEAFFSTLKTELADHSPSHGDAKRERTDSTTATRTLEAEPERTTSTDMVDEIATHEPDRDHARRAGDLSVSAYVFGVVTFVPLLDRSWHTHPVDRCAPPSPRSTRR